MVMCLLTVVTAPLLRCLKWLAPVLLLVVWLGGLWPFAAAGLLDGHCIFFLLGASAGIWRVDLPEWLSHPTGWLTAVLTAAYTCLGLLETVWRGTDVAGTLHNFNILVGIVAAIVLTAYCIRRDVSPVPSAIASTGFFLFGYHGIAIKMLRNTLLPLLRPSSDAAFLAIFAIDFFVTLTVGILLYHAAQRLLPRTTALFCGMR